ncbi:MULTISPECIES: acyl-CoA dehydrogenase family protein [unclassified Streptomyces]|uniref:Acyl-CoA dehydrogenase family protein n=1 Tax=Streptomyces sp. R33 TaxID=3238629 RepID=A0AB39Y9Y0_9ACTN|nr:MULTISPECIES: acyl-CoA dehydrogenase family protein [unclassified Streptomyces]KJY30555.1 acyl-CoA dehydrogenase [Streptomyces sp. NRRL S-444]KOY57243.1 acyl-CoA dehydrogenase [Streptomyces sp. XY332]TDU78749.1 alkylation response protein AidB-like acyl-CoA dehydrogenase [Streptomyces sp. KS 21]THA38895.1 acyl-CoA dehydrogenase [Streptomyces sp. A1547]
MDLTHAPEVEAFRAEARAWLAGHVPDSPLPSLETAEGFAAHREWEAQLYADRWSAVSWPEEYGGRGVDIERWLVFEEEYWAAGAPGRVSQNGISLLAPTLFDHGTPEQRARVLPPMASGEVIWAQAWSEPESGSDLASLTSRAVRTGGGWLLSGQKTWSSRAAFADRAFGIFRTDPGAAKPHQGLTYLMFDLRAPGMTVRPIGRLDGKPAFAELFLDEVFVPDTDVIGEPGQGWRIAMSTTGNERGLTLRSPGRFLAAADRLAGLWRAAGDPADTALRNRVADAAVGARAYELFTWAAASRFAAGERIGAESSLNKVFWSQYDIALHETALDLLGADAELAEGAWAEPWVFSLAGPIYAGTNEIQRDIIAERLLGLPKGRR